MLTEYDQNCWIRSLKMHSMRWRLALSYAGIACMAAIALGAVLLAILRGYYAQQERDYLRNNAESFKILISSAMEEGVPMESLDSQLKNLAFLSKMRIRVLDENGIVLADSGMPDEPQVLLFNYSAPDESVSGLRVQSMNIIAARDAGVAVAGGTMQVQPMVTSVQAVPSDDEGHLVESIFAPFMVYQASGGANSDVMVSTATSAIPLSSTMYGFEVSSGPARQNEGYWIQEQETSSHSGERIVLPITNVDGTRHGSLVVSDGPAYGSEIVKSVALGWLLSGGIAVLLAACVGWFVSRQITKPLLALTTTTARMASGDLSARADLGRSDEVGVLATSFNHMADRIQEIVVTLQRFVADAAHELHTPITALRTNLELLDGDQIVLRRAQEQVIRLQKLTDDLLSLSRLEAHTSTQPAESVDVLPLVSLMGEVYASRAEQSDIDYELNLPDSLPLVKGHADQLECVVTNLLDNALKFTPPGKLVRLSVRQVDSAIELVVEDTGIGIPPGDLPLLFQRFRRGHNTAAYPGSGLGLAIVKAIVEGHGGTVTAENRAPGTAITVVLPAITER
jgi:signal transduction histidine kinase